MFQSLFYWILFFYIEIEKAGKKYTFGFNPYSTGFYSFILTSSILGIAKLVSFNPYSTGFYSFISYLLDYLLEIITVSILILLDSILLYNKENSNNISVEMFQSLFYWILFFYRKVRHLFRCIIGGFNPYSTGFYSFIKEYYKITVLDIKFQSLFYWILFFY